MRNIIQIICYLKELSRDENGILTQDSSNAMALPAPLPFSGSQQQGGDAQEEEEAERVRKSRHESRRS